MRRKYEDNKMSFEAVYLSGGWADATQIWNRKYPTLREFPQQNWLISVQILLSYKCMKQYFLVPVKYTLVCYASALTVLGRMTSIMCPDIKV